MNPPMHLPATLALAALFSTTLGLVARTAEAQGFMGIYTRDGIDVVAVGDSGETFRSLDGGLSWSERVIGSPTRTLRDITGRGLAMLMVGDGGLIWSSADGGGNWTSTLVPLNPNLNAAWMVSDSVWVAAGSGGLILRTTSAGANWSAVTSGTVQSLNALRFTDGQHGWAAGNGGVLLTTANGGASWSPVSVGTPNALLSVDQRGASVWVVGANGTAWRSVNGGVSFSPVNLKLDAQADVRSVTMQSADTLWLAGGGGFIRHTTDGGGTWTFKQHQLLAPITRVIAFDSGMWVTNSKNRVVMSSIDRGTTWRFPTGATSAHSWGATPRYALAQGATRGSTFGLNPVYKNTIYCGLGYNVIRSRDDGETWQLAAAFPSGNDACNAFVVSPKDSNLWLAAISGATATDRVYRTTNGGTTWTSVLSNNFGEYGVPLEMDPDRPDTVLFGGERNGNGSPQDELSRSVDFGATWTSIPTALFRSPCDLVISPDTTGIVLVGDGVTGQGSGRFLKSTDGGLTFTVKSIATSSEIPGLATSRLRPNVVFGTIWGGGGVVRSTDYGETWPTVDNLVQPWGIEVAKDDPNVIVYAQYSTPNITRLSLDGGSTFTSIDPPAGFDNNYSFYARDRATILAEQRSGIWKLQSTYRYTPSEVSQTLQLSSPIGGESWAAGSIHDIMWSSTGIAIARIEYRSAVSEPWQHVADVGGYLNRYSWSVPWDLATHAQVRVFDLWDAAPLDSSNAGFTILVPRFASTPDTVHLPAVQVSYSYGSPLRIDNLGNGTLSVTAIDVSNQKFWVGRTHLTLAGGSSDTVGVFYMPTAAIADTTALTITTNEPGSPHVAIAEGRGIASLAAESQGPATFALWPNRPNPFSGVTMIQYALPREADVRLEIFDLRGQRVATLASGHQAAGRHELRIGPGTPKGQGRLGRMPAGVYFCRLQAGPMTATRKMVLVE